MNSEILTPKHKYWRGFITRLGNGIQKYGCNHQTFDIIEQILRTLPNISISETMGYFEEKGVFCNCGVYHNTDWRRKRNKE